MVHLEKFPKIDAHFHSTYYDPVYEKIAKEYNLSYININTDTTIFPPIEEQEAIALDYVQRDSKRFAYISGFEMENRGKPGWYENVFKRIEASVASGAVGIKIWKNIGMKLLKPDGSFLMIDDSFFEPFFKFLNKIQLPILSHLGEPKNCWLPLELMTSHRNREYYTKYPEHHAYLHPEMPSYERQIASRDNLLEKYPGLIFIGAHLGSLEWSCEELSKRFDRYPNFYVDLSSRLGHLQIQSADKYDEVRCFLNQYAERILYGTDAYNNPEKLMTALNDDWKFLSTFNNCKSAEVPGTFKGFALPEEILFQIYFGNAKKIYSGLNF